MDQNGEIEISCRSGALRVGEIDDETLLRIAELRSSYSEHDGRDNCWAEIAAELGIDASDCKTSFFKAISRFKGDRDNSASRLCEILSCLDDSINYEYCIDNFSELCRFCLRLRSDVSVHEILDSSNEGSNGIQLIDKIRFTVLDEALQTIDYKLNNLICDQCRRRIDGFYSFKKECNRNIQIMLEVKSVLEGLQTSDALQEEEERVVATEVDMLSDLREEEECLEDDNEDELIAKQFEKGSDEESQISSESVEESTKPKKVKLKRGDKRDRKLYKGKNSQCPICGKLVKGIQMHMLIHTGERRHKCSYCSKTFTQSGQLKRHVNSHLDIRNYKCPDPSCDRTFVDPSSVTKHLVVHNKDDRKFQCSLCGSRFNRLGALRYHEKTHRQERNFSCEICKKSFLAKYDLTKHIRTHTGEKPYGCKFCDKRFSISKNAKVHLRVHTKERPYQCKVCDLSFAYRSSMKSHMVKVHNQVDATNPPISISMKDPSDKQPVVQSIETIEVELENQPLYPVLDMI